MHRLSLQNYDLCDFHLRALGSLRMIYPGAFNYFVYVSLRIREDDRLILDSDFCSASAALLLLFVIVIFLLLLLC